MRVAIYARVSTSDTRLDHQDPETQLRQLRERCVNAGHDIVHEYVEHVSGGKAKEQRPQFAAMFNDAHRRKFDMVLCCALDRFSREGMVPTVLHLQRLASYGVGFHSYTESALSTDNEMVRDIVLACMAGLAKQERLRHRHRAVAGLERARSKRHTERQGNWQANGKPAG
jgi:DNA invertase Pin-like site-specific DNA recombinase